MENKQEICNELCKVLQLTRDGKNIVALHYCRQGLEYPESVIVQHKNGYSKEINVHMDSGCAMVYDIMEYVAH